jgi:CubicO group peptidase (beta-lactamase class C family)
MKMMKSKHFNYAIVVFVLLLTAYGSIAAEHALITQPELPIAQELQNALFESQAEQGFAIVPSDVPVNERFTSFETHLDTIRQALKIPGMSAAVVQNQELVWAAGFGYADLENQVVATPDTPYGLASVTKPVAAVLIMQLVEQGLVDLDAPLTQYGVNMDNDDITVRHLLTHTSEGVLGTVHNYNGSRYARLGGVMEGASGQTFATLLSERVLLPLGMYDTALNPVNNWGGLLLTGVNDFKVALGWGPNFQHYPDVYAHLAQPYQFDHEYNFIPGMYHLYHNPGAGLISSVNDLAKFDIALDNGLLLGDVAKSEMFSPAYSTYNNQSDLMYGLGWYIQEFEGLQLFWHTGRWPPSTSALYLKVPDKDLTLIVLANTDNLTVPFYSIGCCGDVSKSILTLAFFRHFIFPQQHGVELASIDWKVSQGELVRQLDEVEDPAARIFLERELWSFRQVFASTGQHGQAEKLRRVSFHTFSNSSFRGDELFTSLTGQYPLIPPTVPASAYVWISWGMAIWFLLTFISLIWMMLRLGHAKQLFRWDGFVWLLATLFLGPISLGIHALTYPRSSETPPEKWRKAWSASLLIISGYTLAWCFAIAILQNLGFDPHPLMILGTTYLAPLLVGLFFIRVPLLSRQIDAGFGRVASQCLLSEIITLNVGFSVLFPLTMFLGERLFTTIPHLSSPYFWGMIAFMAAVGLLIQFPLNYWMTHRRYWIPSDEIPEGTHDLNLPTMRGSWVVLLITIVILVGALVATIQQMA